MDSAIVEYLRMTAESIIEDEDVDERRYVLWNGFSPEQKEMANELVEGIFGEWL